MKQATHLKTVLISIGIVMCFLNTKADVTMPSIFSDNMVLQKDTNIPVWGKADPGENITVKFAGLSKTAITENDGKWKVILAPLSASNNSSQMTVSGKNTIKIKNILIGDVWLASGQSNMAFKVKGSNNSKEEIKNGHYSSIRFFAIKRNISSFSQDDCEGKWLVCRPETVGQFYAVAYYFARELNKKYHIPQGVIGSAIGGSTCEAWVPREILQQNKSFPKILKIQDEKYSSVERYNKYRSEMLNSISYKDTGIKAEYKEWKNPDFDDSEWKNYDVPNYFHSQGYNMNGAIWFRHDVNIPEDLAGKNLALYIGPLRNIDTTYFNGKKIGSTDSKLKSSHFRTYRIPGELIKPGKNVVAIRIFNTTGNGGFMRYPKPQGLYKGRKLVANLRGNWKCKVEVSYLPRNLPFHMPPYIQIPAGLFNAMIHPFIQFPVRGFLWYQGESNTSRAKQHDKLFPALISSWRKLWKDEELPFYFVQLANYKARLKKPSNSSWANFRESQSKALGIPHTGMAVTIDIGEGNNIHPKNKQDVGKRLARWAMKDCYGEKDIEVSGPLYKSNEIDGNKIIISFTHTTDGVKAKGDKLTGFAIAGIDKKFIWANAEIKDDKVIVWSDKVKEPLYVRYAWAENPECNLYNGKNLPASPFRTDNEQQ